MVNYQMQKIRDRHDHVLTFLKDKDYIKTREIELRLPYSIQQIKNTIGFLLEEGKIELRETKNIKNVKAYEYKVKK